MFANAAWPWGQMQILVGFASCAEERQDCQERLLLSLCGWRKTAWRAGERKRGVGLQRVDSGGRKAAGRELARTLENMGKEFLLWSRFGEATE